MKQTEYNYGKLLLLSHFSSEMDLKATLLFRKNGENCKNDFR
jgi:hypothetical protein